MRRACLAAFFALLSALPALCGANPLARSLTLVAKPEFQDPLYARTVLVVTAFGVDQHLGFIVNRPGPYTLGKMFPGHGPSQKVLDPVFVGGPVDASAIFALVARANSPGRGSIEIMPGLYAAIDGRTVDRIIEANPHDARFVRGLVVWRPGELGAEIAQGAWYVLDADASLAVRDPQGLWTELVTRAQRSHDLFRTGSFKPGT
jgi:putative transcriptional regulator